MVKFEIVRDDKVKRIKGKITKSNIFSSIISDNNLYIYPELMIT